MRFKEDVSVRQVVIRKFVSSKRYDTAAVTANLSSPIIGTNSPFSLRTLWKYLTKSVISNWLNVYTPLLF